MGTTPPHANLRSSLPREGREETPSHLLLSISYLYKISSASGLSHLGCSVCFGVVIMALWLEGALPSTQGWPPEVRDSLVKCVPSLEGPPFKKESH